MKSKKEKGILISFMGFIQGGAEIMPIRIANYLHKQNYRVGIHCIQKNVNEDIRKLLCPDIPVYFTERSVELAAIVMLHHYEVIHSHCVSSQQIVARMVRRFPFFKIRHVATSHGGYEGLNDVEAVNILKSVDPFVSCWTCVADNNMKLFYQAGIMENKIHKIGNAMETPQEICPVNWKDYGIPENAIVFTVITRAVWKKCWPECIAAAEMARERSGADIHLVLAGTGPVYEELIVKPQKEFIHFVGEITDPCAFYKASYCGLLLSVRECAPLGLIEMYQAGIPVIATDTGDVSEMMKYKDGLTGILISLTPSGKVPVKDAADAICMMIKNPKMYEEYQKNAKNMADEFSMANVNKKYLECYKMSVKED